MKNLLILILVFIFSNSYSANYKYGKVSKDEVTQSAHPMEPTADAAILYQEGKATLTYNVTSERFEVTREIYKRIKIYDHTTTDYGQLSIPYFNHSWNKEKIQNIKGSVYNSINGKVKESKIKKEHIFDEKLSKYRSKKKIAFPNIRKGSVIEIKYKIITPYSSRVPSWKFQYDIPCDKSVYSVEFPEWFTYNVSSKGNVIIDTKKENKNRSIQYKYSYDASNSNNIVQKKTKYERIPYVARVSTYTTNNVPALKNEDFVPYMDNYRSAISFELLRTQMPNSMPKAYTESWSGISKMIHGHDEVGALLSKKVKGTEGLVSEAKEMSKTQGAAHIYNYVRDNFTWNSYYGIRSDVGFKKLMKEKTGNVADINLLLCNLLRKADIDATLIATRSRDYGFINATHPSQLDLNYLLVQIDDETGKTHLLDATEKNVEFGHLPGRALNLKGITVRSSGGREVPIKNPNIGSNKVVAKATITDEMTLDLLVKSKHQGYAASTKAQEYSSLGDNDAIMDYQESKYEGRSYEVFEKDNSTNAHNELKTEERFYSSDALKEINDKLYIDAFFGLIGSENPFTAETRELPIFKDQMLNKKTTIVLDVPEGYSIESLPDEMQISLPESMEKFTYTVSSQADKVIINIIVSENSDILNPVHYEGIKKYYEMVEAKASEKIVLVKV